MCWYLLSLLGLGRFSRIIGMYKSPAFQWYPKDFLTDLNVVVMTLEQRGAYITLLSQCWLEGDLPIEPTKLQAICNHPSNWSEIWDGIKGCFVENSSGKYVNLRLEAERNKQKEWLEKSSRGGKRSAELRRESKGGSLMVGSKGEPSANTSSSSSSSKRKKRKRREYPTGFERLWGIHPKGGKINAYEAMERYDPNESELDAWIEKLTVLRETEQWTKDGGKWAKDLSAWINGGYFDGELPSSNILITYKQMFAEIDKGVLSQSDYEQVPQKEGNPLWQLKSPHKT